MAATWKQNALAVLQVWLLTCVAVSAMIVDDVSEEVHNDDAATVISGPAVTTEVVTSPLPTVPTPPPNRRILARTGWKCPLVTPVSNVTLDTIMGRWFLLEVMSASKDNRRDACAGVDFWRWGDSVGAVTLAADAVQPPDASPQHLVMRGFNRRGSERASNVRIDTTIVVPGSGDAVWDQPGFGPALGLTVAVLDYTPDQRVLTLQTCVHGYTLGWTSVLGRDPNTTDLHLDDLHQRLRAAGAVNVDRAVLQDNAGCVYRNFLEENEELIPYENGFELKEKKELIESNATQT